MKTCISSHETRRITAKFVVSGIMKCMFQRRRCYVFSTQSTIYFNARKYELWYKMKNSTPSVLRFLSVILHEFLHYNHVFIEKAQHLRRWISLWMLTRGRLVPRQPRAIKRTTRTELRGETIVRVAWLIIKRKTIWCKSSRNLPRFTRWNGANYRVICIILQHHLYHFEKWGLGYERMFLGKALHRNIRVTL